MKNTLYFELFNCFFIRSWWVITFFFACTIMYEQGLKKRNTIYQQLTEQSALLQIEKQKLLLRQQNLQLQINSQSDRAWVELILMKELGLVPEEQCKVYFYSSH